MKSTVYVYGSDLLVFNPIIDDEYRLLFIHTI